MIRMFFVATACVLAMMTQSSATSEFIAGQDGATTCLSENQSAPERCLQQIYSPCANLTDEKARRFCVNDVVRGWSIAANAAKEDLHEKHGDLFLWIREPQSSYDRTRCGELAHDVVFDPAQGSGIHNALCLALARAARWSLFFHRASEISSATSQLAADLAAMRTCILETAAAGNKFDCIGLLSADCSPETGSLCLSTREEQLWQMIFLQSNKALPKGKYVQMMVSGELQQFRADCMSAEPSCKSRKAIALAGQAIHLFLAAKEEAE